MGSLVWGGGCDRCITDDGETIVGVSLGVKITSDFVIRFIGVKYGATTRRETSYSFVARGYLIHYHHKKGYGTLSKSLSFQCYNKYQTHGNILMLFV